MTECVRAQRINCVGSIENNSDLKLQVTIIRGVAVDDQKHEYAISTYPYYVGYLAIFFVGNASGGGAHELVPHLPIKVGIQFMNLPPQVTAMNINMTFSTNGDPAQSEILFTDIPVREQ